MQGVSKRTGGRSPVVEQSWVFLPQLVEILSAERGLVTGHIEKGATRWQRLEVRGRLA